MQTILFYKYQNLYNVKCKIFFNSNTIPYNSKTNFSNKLKFMKNYISLLVITVMTFCNINSFAQANKQHTWSLNFGPEIIAPERKFWETHKIGLGGSVKGEYTFGKHSSLTINTGLIIF